VWRVEVRVGRCGYAGKTFEQGDGGCVEELVGDAEDTSLADGAEMMPVALGDDFFDGDSGACAAPGKEKDVGVGGGDGFRGGVGAGFSEVSAAGGIYEFGYPVLGVDEGLAPFFAVDAWGVRASGGFLA
jgi:hypothetical protein